MLLKKASVNVCGQDVQIKKVSVKDGSGGFGMRGGGRGGSGGTTDSERVSTEPACTSSGAGAGVADTEAVGNLQKLVDETLSLSKS